MRKYVFSLFMLFSLSIQAALQPADFSQMRQRMLNDIVLAPEQYNPEHPAIKQYIEKYALLADSLWQTMRQDTTFLWEDQAILIGDKAYTPYHVHRSYLRLHAMTLAWGYPSSPLYHNEALLAAIRYGLNLLASGPYNPATQKVGNWWEWCIGIPFDYSHIVCILYDVLSPEELQQFEQCATYRVRPIVEHGNLTYANQASVCRNLMFIGVLTNNEGCIRSALINSVPAFVDTTSVATRVAAQQMYEDIIRNQSRYQHNTILWAKEGLYEDGTFIQHVAIPYIGTYGVEMAELAADMSLLLKDTELTIPQPILDVLPLWVFKTYLPALYRGGFMTMFMGRGGYKRNPYYYGRACVLNLYHIIDLLPQEQQPTLLQACRDMLLSDKYIAGPYEKMDPMPIIVNTVEAIQASGEANKTDTPFSHVYAAGDKVVHQMAHARFGLSMSSNRIGKYEAFITAVDAENTIGWYMGDGMTYLYTPDDLMQYVSYIRKINPYLVPGTTADRMPRESIMSDMVLFSHSPKAVDVARAGGATLNNLYSVAGMQLLGFQGDLYAKKAWFMFDEEVVCLGADIHQQPKREVLTVIENRLTDNPISLHKKYAYLPSVAGYYFPEKVKPIVHAADNGCQEMYISHGVAPTNGHYAYTLLPCFSESQTQAYASHPKTQILANNAIVQAVRKDELAITAAYFYAAGKVGSIQSDGAAAIIMQQCADTLTIAVSDPTWERESQQISLKGYYQLLDEQPARLCSVRHERNQTLLSVQSKNRFGQTTTIKLIKIK